MSGKGSGRDAVAAFIKHAEEKEPGIDIEKIVAFLANAEDKAMAYKVKGLPVPAGLTDDKATGLSFFRTPPKTDA